MPLCENLKPGDKPKNNINKGTEPSPKGRTLCGKAKHNLLKGRDGKTYTVGQQDGVNLEAEGIAQEAGSPRRGSYTTATVMKSGRIVYDELACRMGRQSVAG
jgi:hypothetical protein